MHLGSAAKGGSPAPPAPPGLITRLQETLGTHFLQEQSPGRPAECVVGGAPGSALGGGREGSRPGTRHQGLSCPPGSHGKSPSLRSPPSPPSQDVAAWEGTMVSELEGLTAGGGRTDTPDTGTASSHPDGGSRWCAAVPSMATEGRCRSGRTMGSDLTQPWFEPLPKFGS